MIKSSDEKIVILTMHISNYHNIRYQYSSSLMNITVVSVMNDGDFKEFLFNKQVSYKLIKLFDSKSEYMSSILNNSLESKLFSIFNDENPSVIVTAGWSNPESLLALKYAKDNGIRIVTLSESQEDDSERSYLREKVKSRIVRLFDAALVGSQSHKDYAVKLGLSENCVFTGYNVIDNDYYESFAKVARQNERELRALYNLPNSYFLVSSRFIEKKNIVNLIQAYAKYCGENKNANKLIILGGGDLKDVYLKLISELSMVDNIFLKGFIDYDTLPVFYGLADSFIHVPTTEQWGLVINEAVASGIPVLSTTRCGAARALLTGGAGIIVDANVNSIFDGIKELSSLTSYDREKMVRISRDKLKFFTPSQFALNLQSACLAARDKKNVNLPSKIDLFLINNIAKKFVNSVS